MRSKSLSALTLISIILLFAACGSAPSVSPSAPNSSAASPSPSPSFGDPESAGEDWTLEDDPCFWNFLPMSHPDISGEDMASFNPAKTADYIVANGVWHNYTIVKAELKDGKLYITITDYRCSYDVNDDYKYLKDRFGLPGDEILALPEFSECVTHKGILYASEDALNDRLQYDSYEKWKGYQIAANGMPLGEISLPALPVSEDAKICLYYMDDITNTGQFSDYLLQGGTVRDLAMEDAQLFNMLLKYENEQITGIYQDSGDA